MRINPIERRILQVLLINGGLLNKNEIAGKAGISWNTAQTYLNKLYNRGWVRTKRKGKISYYFANY